MSSCVRQNLCLDLFTQGFLHHLHLHEFAKQVQGFLTHPLLPPAHLRLPVAFLPVAQMVPSQPSSWRLQPTATCLDTS